MSTFEIVHSDGRVNRMRLFGDTTDPAAEVAKWPESDRATVVEIRPVDGFTERLPVVAKPTIERAPLPANQIATGAAQYTDIPECTVAELAELAVHQAIATDCRKPNENAGEGSGMLVFRVQGKWFTSAGTPAAA